MLVKPENVALTEGGDETAKDISDDQEDGELLLVPLDPNDCRYFTLQEVGTHEYIASSLNEPVLAKGQLAELMDTLYNGRKTRPALIAHNVIQGVPDLAARIRFEMDIQKPFRVDAPISIVSVLGNGLPPDVTNRAFPMNFEWQQAMEKLYWPGSFRVLDAKKSMYDKRVSQIRDQLPTINTGTNVDRTLLSLHEILENFKPSIAIANQDVELVKAQITQSADQSVKGMLGQEIALMERDLRNDQTWVNIVDKLYLDVYQKAIGVPQISSMQDFDPHALLHYKSTLTYDFKPFVTQQVTISVNYLTLEMPNFPK